MIINPAPFVTDFPRDLKPAIVRWVIPGWFGTNITNQLLYAGRVSYIPIFVSQNTTYDRIGINVTTLGAGTVALAVYEWELGLPTNRILAAGNVDVSTTGMKEIVISELLTRGYYFLAHLPTVNVSVQALDDLKAVRLPVSGLQTTQSLIYNQPVLQLTGALTDPATAPTMTAILRHACVSLREA